MIFILILVTGVFWFNPEEPLNQDMLIVTAVPSDIDLLHDDLGIDGRYVPRAQIIAHDIHDQENDDLILTEEFYSARSPEVSYDGKKMVFAGQKDKEATWQIFIKDLESLQVTQVTQSPVNCTDPAWLPDGRIIFSRLNKEESGGQIHVLYVCNPDGSNKKRLTFHPNSDISSSVTNDGRIISLSEQKYPNPGIKQIFALRTDGTKFELFYKSIQQKIPVSRCWEADGQIYFIEQEMPLVGRRELVTVAFGHPLSSWKSLSADDPGEYHSLYPLNMDQLIVAYRPERTKSFGLYVFNTKDKKTENLIFGKDDFHLIEPVILTSRTMPLKLPEIVDEAKVKGTLLCHDAELSMMPVEGFDEKKLKIHKVQVFGLDRMLGEVPVEEDGSFYIQIDADTPVRFQTVNADGEILRGPSAWIWVRPNERRSCIGCHEDRELAPENKVPDALYNGMVSLPEGTKTEAIVLSDK